jgi:chromosome segregation ATPase
MMKEKSSQKLEQGQFNNMFNHIMKANIPGVIGRLGDLGDVPKQYEEAVCTACSRLDNIVT